MRFLDWLGFRRRGPDAKALARGDPWVRLPFVPPLGAFGPGAQDEFVHYLEGSSRVDAATPQDIAGWLLECRYAPDEQLLDDPDLWQHPCTFELVRSGDCEDYALWAWRKLTDAGYDADFVVGMHRRQDGQEARHAWVVFRDAGVEYLLDGVQRDAAEVVRPCRELTNYVPQVGVTRVGRRFIFAGLYRSEWGRRLPLDQSTIP